MKKLRISSEKLKTNSKKTNGLRRFHKKTGLKKIGFILMVTALLLMGSNSIFAADKDSDQDGLPDGVEKIYQTNPYSVDTDGDGKVDKEDDNPLFLDNPIKETSTKTLPVEVKDARVEDNFIPDQGDAPDHLQITLINNGKNDIKGLEIYYTITDKKAADEEAYYQKLDITLSAGEKIVLHFDNQEAPGHYPGNMNGLYGNSTNGLTFDVILHSPGYKPIDFKIEKDPGAAEVAD